MTKKVFLAQNRKSEHDHKILYIPISLSTNNFECLLQSKTKKSYSCVTYYIIHFRMGADRDNGVLVSLLHLVAETTKVF